MNLLFNLLLKEYKDSGTKKIQNSTFYAQF